MYQTTLVERAIADGAAVCFKREWYKNAPVKGAPAVVPALVQTQVVIIEGKIPKSIKVDPFRAAELRPWIFRSRLFAGIWNGLILWQDGQSGIGRHGASALGRETEKQNYPFILSH